MLVLGIETSCDETAAAVVEVETRSILSNVLYSQYAEHAPYGGVIPELASRTHLERLPAILTATLKEANVEAHQLDAIAATTGPGLTTALLMGATFGKTLALGLNKPFLAANHIEGHALSPHLTDATLEFPYLLLLVSGGHTQLVMVNDVGSYDLLGTSADDAAGECFDKVGKLLGLPHPAGPAIEKLATTGNASAITLPMPKNDKSLDFSFSGLKTAVRDFIANRTLRSLGEGGLVANADIAAALQITIATVLARKCARALEQTGAKTLVAAGGVAANKAIRTALQQAAAQHGACFSAPPLSICTDNAAMVAYAAGLRHLQSLPNGTLSTPTRPRWPLGSAASEA